jgi:hypothetical protein
LLLKEHRLGDPRMMYHRVDETPALEPAIELDGPTKHDSVRIECSHEASNDRCAGCMTKVGAFDVQFDARSRNEPAAALDESASGGELDDPDRVAGTHTAPQIRWQLRGPEP